MTEAIRPVAIPFEYPQRNASVGWHALRGYDFAGFESMLVSGIYPAGEQVHDRGVSMSYNPSQNSPFAPISMAYYTLKPGLSVQVNLLEANTFKVNQNNHEDVIVDKKSSHTEPIQYGYGGFDDELRRAFVEPNQIIGVMLPEVDLDRPVAEAETEHEPRSWQQFGAYMDRTVEHIADLGGEAPDFVVDDLVESYRDGDMSYKRDAARFVEGSFMDAYSSAASSVLDTDNPTVGELISLVQTRANPRLNVLTFSDEVSGKVKESINMHGIWKQRRKAGLAPYLDPV